MKTILLCTMLIPFLLLSQIRTVRVEQLPVPATEVWNAPRFSPAGTDIFLTNADHHGIWRYSIPTRLLKQITSDRYAGFGFAVSDDGATVSYRTTVIPGDHRTRVQESVTLSVTTGVRTVLHSGNSVEVPRFVRNTAVAPEQLLSRSDAPILADAPITVLGTSDDGIRLLRNGTVVTLAPLGKGQYLWPQLSPDGRKIVATEMDNGTFIADIDGRNVVRLGRCNAPQWTRSGAWVIGMEDTDDGHDVTGSEIIAVSADGTQRVALTNTPAVHEMYPAVSPDADVIVAVTYNGAVLMLTYTEGK